MKIMWNLDGGGVGGGGSGGGGDGGGGAGERELEEIFCTQVASLRQLRNCHSIKLSANNVRISSNTFGSIKIISF